MFEVALALGIHRGELLKLRLDLLPRGANDGVLILRRPDDPNDSRPHEPAVKTAERAIPASRFLLAAIRAYLTHPPPLGRVSGKSPYLFVVRSGEPLSSDRADDVIVAIGHHAGVTLYGIAPFGVGFSYLRKGSRDRCLLLLLFRHGLRVSEGCGLELSQVDTESRVLHVHRLKHGLSTDHPLRGDELRAISAWLKAATG